MYLLDTNVVSELRRPRPHKAVLDWVATVPTDSLRLSAVTIGEIQAGIEITRAQDAGKAAELESWLDGVVATYAVISMDAAIFRAWVLLKHKKPDNLLEDAMIAATATVHGLTIVTRNTRDFQTLGLTSLNPFTNRQGA